MSRNLGCKGKSEEERKENKQRAMSMLTFPMWPGWACCRDQDQPRCGMSHKGHRPMQLLPLLLRGQDPGVPQDPGALGHVWGTFSRHFAFKKIIIAEAFYPSIDLCLIKKSFPTKNFRAKTVSVSPWILDF